MINRPYEKRCAAILTSSERSIAFVKYLVARDPSPGTVLLKFGQTNGIVDNQ